MVSLASLVFICASGLITVGLPIALLIYYKIRQGVKIMPVFFGILGFVVFVLILERLLHNIVLKPDENGLIPLMEEPSYFVLYVIFAAGIFEETARLISFKILRSNYKGVRTGLAYGVGHGGAESVLLVGSTMINNLVLSIMINNGNIGFLGDSPQIQTAVYALVNSEAILFMVGGIERIITIALQISLSVLVWYAATSKRKIWLFPTAILLHAAVDVPAAMMQADILTNIWFVEGLLAVGTLVVVLIASSVHRRFQDVYAFENSFFGN